MKNIFLIGTVCIFIFSACTPDDSENKWQHTKLSKIVRTQQHEAITKNHNKTIYGTWCLSTNQNITLKFSDESIWQYCQKSAANGGSDFINGNNFTMSNNTLHIYKKDGEIITGNYNFNNRNNLTTTNFRDNRFNGTWTRR